ncbi:hypothetical protein Clacol_008141 [Clathrus columnatus]|uniref:Ras-domain-containing protein n=1 Tax=Clathrus columnatus TaxID=1419009 RepID=A0AAV5AMD4_9AGAM|nr:hypothetical protein Clacol_008141 [Clathrus columnatus]
MPTNDYGEATELLEAYDFLLKCVCNRLSSLFWRADSIMTLPFQAKQGPENRAPAVLMPIDSQTTFSAHDWCGVFKQNGQRWREELWDTAGQERFRSVTRSYYRGAAGAILVYDITDRSTFLNLSRWLADARALASPHLVIVLVGNKSDKEEDREVEWSEASRWAAQNNVHFIETSSLNGDNVEAPFLLAARSILLSIESGALDPEKAGSGVSYGDRSLRRITMYPPAIMEEG